MNTFHIRRRLTRARGNQFYRDQNNRDQGTYCGAEPTDHDIRWNWPAVDTWGGWKACRACVKERGPRLGNK